MKKTFEWYFPPTESQIKEIWKEGILTVDANVLLDLYRYHQNTSQALLDSINGFKGRAWISHQAADEFFRNRNGVILSSSGAFNDAERNLSDFKKSIEEPLKRLKNNRIIPDELEVGLKDNIDKAIKNADEEILKIKNKFPDYTKEDPILENICNLFDSSVGPAFNKDTLPDVLKEAKRRKENKIAPGFKDSNKVGDKPYGDYIVWRQILDHIKEAKKPLIFVTSEEKEDWWEKASGKTIGPLYELIKEFHEETGQRLLLYRTARFLEYANENSGKKANTAAVAEIIEVASQSPCDCDEPACSIDGPLSVDLNVEFVVFTLTIAFSSDPPNIALNMPVNTSNAFIIESKFVSYKDSTYTEVLIVNPGDRPGAFSILANISTTCAANKDCIKTCRCYKSVTVKNQRVF